MRYKNHYQVYDDEIDNLARTSYINKYFLMISLSSFRVVSKAINSLF